MADFTVGKYLAARFEQIGLKHYFMVPGDYNLVLLDELLDNENLEQIGCCNELNAAYAAEGYARVNGAGAVLTTYNVGAYSALNGVAGAYAERLPVIFVSSGPNTNDAGENHILHHTMGTHDFFDQYEVCRQVTCAAVRILHPDNAPALIDEAISTALRERKPAYIEIACNLSAAPCPEPAPVDRLLASTMLAWQPTNPQALTAAVDRAGQLLEKAKKPILLAGAHLRSYGAIDAFRELAEALGSAVAVMPNAKGFFPEDHPQYAGIYWGEVSTPQCQAIVDWADLIVAAGPVFSDYTTVGWSAQPPRQKLISAEPQVVRFAGRRIHRRRAGRLPVRPGQKGPSQRRHPSAIPSPQADRLRAGARRRRRPAEPRRAVAPDRGRPRRQDHTDGGNRYLLVGRHVHPAARRRTVRDRDAMGLHRLVRAGCLRLLDGPGTRPAPGRSHRRRLLPADRPGSVQHDPPRPRDPDLPGQQPRIRDRIGDPRRPLQLLQELGLRRPDRRVQRRRRPRPGADRHHANRTGRRDRQSPRPQGRPGPHRMPNPQ